MGRGEGCDVYPGEGSSSGREEEVGTSTTTTLRRKGFVAAEGEKIG